MEVFCDKKTSKNINKFYCEYCDFKCSKKGDWSRHITRAKHINLAKCDDQVTKKTYIYICELCDKKYSSRNGLWKHKQTCIFSNDKHKDEHDNEEKEEIIIDGINIKDKDALVIHLLKQNGELQNKLIEMSSQMGMNNSHNNNHSNNNHSNNNHSNNKTFNLQFFLNETCKNAMNMSEFVSSIQMDLDDLEHTGRTNYVEGISSIVIKNLNKLEEQLRPLHCTDAKREVLYIKENNEWKKETEDKTNTNKSY